MRIQAPRGAPFEPEGVVGRVACCTWMAAALAIVGCESAGRRPYPDDPLLLSKKPVRGDAAEAAPDLLARAEPAPPPGPYAAPADRLVAHEAKRVAPADGDGPARPIDTSKGPTPAVPAARRGGDSATDLPPLRRQVPEKFGHAADYRWLQGVLEADGPGGLLLHYADAGKPGAGGGTVRLLDDGALARYRAGDQVLVAGTLQGKPTAGAAYHVRDAWLVHRGE